MDGVHTMGDEALEVVVRDNSLIVVNDECGQYSSGQTLSIVEALWLIYTRHRKIIYNNRILEMEDLLKIAGSEFVWITFTVYNDLKNRGKRIEVLGNNLLSINMGTRVVDIYVLEENNLVSLSRLIEMIEISNRRGRDVVFALVDKHGDVTYYSTSPITL